MPSFIGTNMAGNNTCFQRVYFRQYFSFLKNPFIGPLCYTAKNIFYRRKRKTLKTNEVVLVNEVNRSLMRHKQLNIYVIDYVVGSGKIITVFYV